MAAKVEFCLLGRFSVRRDGRSAEIPYGKQRVLLAALLLNVGRVVSVGELSEALWETEPPASARVTVQNYVKRLRATLGDEDHGRIKTVPPGYLIQVQPGELDVARFESLLQAGQGDIRAGRWAEAAARLREGLALWRGEPLDGVPSSSLTLNEVPRLAELRLHAIEARIGADLHLGRHATVVAELRKLTRAHPLRENLHALLMLALYRDGRQADALAAYQAIRELLVRELGAEPGIELRTLQQKILAQDATLAQAAAEHMAGEVSQLATPADAAELPAARQRTVVPRQLPAARRHFTGRDAELRSLTSLLNEARDPGTVMIVAIAGMPGIGKTALALHWSHQVAGQFPDGQLYTNLRGFDVSGVPMDPGAAIRGFLAALQVPAQAIPGGLEAQAALYRSVLAGRRILVVLDNAHDAAQLRPLLPGTPGSLVLVTSRRQLSSLVITEGAHALTLNLLTLPEAGELLVRHLGAGRVAAEPEAADELIELCGRLPLALAIVAARAVARAAASLAVLAAELRGELHRLDALDAGEASASARTVFSWSLDNLSEPAARMFRLLSVHPGPDITGPAAASLAAVPLTQARLTLAELTAAHLVAEQSAGRYTLHDLLRAYAAEQARGRREETGDAEFRMLDHYLHSCQRVSRLLDPAKDPVPLPAPQPGVLPEQPGNYGEALAWAEAEHQVLLGVIAQAARSGHYAHAWQIPLATETFLLRRGYWHDLADTQRTAFAAATRLGDLIGQARASHGLGRACAVLGSLAEAQEHLSRAQQLYDRLGDQMAKARAHIDLSHAFSEHAHYGEALAHAEQARDLFQAVGHRTGHATALNNIGWSSLHLGRYEQAVSFCRQAVDVFREAGDRYGVAAALDTLGYALHLLGDQAGAGDRCREALAAFAELGDRYNQANVRTHLGDIRSASGDLAAARGEWQQALAILEKLGHPDVGKLRDKLRAATGSSGTAALQ